MPRASPPGRPLLPPESNPKRHKSNADGVWKSTVGFISSLFTYVMPTSEDAGGMGAAAPLRSFLSLACQWVEESQGAHVQD